VLVHADNSVQQQQQQGKEEQEEEEEEEDCGGGGRGGGRRGGSGGDADDLERDFNETEQKIGHVFWVRGSWCVLSLPPLPPSPALVEVPVASFW
jgi:hypothetical protein